MGSVGRKVVSSHRAQTSFIRVDSTRDKHLVLGLGFFGRVVKMAGTLGTWGSRRCPPVPCCQQRNRLWALRGHRAAAPAVPVAASEMDAERPKEEKMLSLAQQAAMVALLTSHRQHRQLPTRVCMLPRLGSPSRARQCRIVGICQSVWNLTHLFKFILRINPPASAGLCKTELGWASEEISLAEVIQTGFYMSSLQFLVDWKLAEKL